MLNNCDFLNLQEIKRLTFKIIYNQESTYSIDHNDTDIVQLLKYQLNNLNSFNYKPKWIPELHKRF
jgi:hypothetical protein